MTQSENRRDGRKMPGPAQDSRDDDAVFQRQPDLLPAWSTGKGRENRQENAGSLRPDLHQHLLEARVVRLHALDG
ncbi:MAG: hypothetical protein QHH04_09770, partial [Methanolinea sp.]|nr:hypothetical protein [Methanolinea sp.]